MNEPDRSLPKKEVIRHRGGFGHVFEKGTCWTGKCLRVFFIKGETRQIGFAVPKRLGKAVARNRMKRLMREAYRKHRHEIGHYSMVMLATERMRSVRYRDVEDDFQRFLGKAGVGVS